MTIFGTLMQSGAVLTHYVSKARLEKLNEEIPKICILTGDYDCLVDPKNSEYMHQVMDKSELVVWEETGHAINIQRPTLFNDLLERVWAEGREGRG